MALEAALQALVDRSSKMAGGSMQVSPQEQAGRDQTRLRILQTEAADPANANDAALQKELATELTKQNEPLSGALQALTEAPTQTMPTQAKVSPTPQTTPKSETESDLLNAAAGAGKGITDIARGAKQLLDIPAQWLESKFPGLTEWSQKSLGMPSAAESAAATNADVAESKRLDVPLMETKAGMAGNIGAQIAGTMLPLGAAAKGSTVASALLNPTTYKAAAAVGGLQGALQPTTPEESKLANVGIGAAAGLAGNAAINTLGRVAQPIAQIASSAHAKAVRVLENAGIPLDAAQKSGSVVLNRIRSAFFDNPLTVGRQAEQVAGQQVGFNRAVLKTIGEDAEAATSTVMGNAEKRINGVFKDILDRNNVTVNDTILGRIGTIQSAAAESEKGPIVKVANRIVDAVDENGQIKGQIAYGIKKDLDRLANSADTDLAYHARQLRSTVMDAINGSLDTADRQAFAQARGQFANMKRIEPAIDKMGNGDISPARLANVMGQKANRATSIYGKGPQELTDLAQAGNLLLRDKMPQSGTTPRAVMQAVLPIAGALAGADYGGTQGAGLGTAAGLTLNLVGPRALQSAMLNPIVSKYIAGGMQGPMTPIKNILLSPQNSELIGGIAKRIAPTIATTKRPSTSGK